MSSIVASVAAAVIGLLGSILAFQNGRFAGPLDRATRIESLTKTLASNELDPNEAYALRTVRRQLILDEYYKQFGPKLYKYALALSFVSGIGGAVGVANLIWPFLGEHVTMLARVQLGLAIVICAISLVQNTLHAKFVEQHGKLIGAG